MPIESPVRNMNERCVFSRDIVAIWMEQILTVQGGQEHGQRKEVAHNHEKMRWR